MLAGNSLNLFPDYRSEEKTPLESLMKPNVQIGVLPILLMVAWTTMNSNYAGSINLLISHGKFEHMIRTILIANIHWELLPNQNCTTH